MNPTAQGATAQELVTVHIIDDDISFRTAIARQVRAGTGHTVRTYAAADEFLNARPDEGPGCILLDYLMPGTNGLEMQKALASRAQTLPIIFLSGRAEIPVSVEAMKAGAIDFLTKPVTSQVLLPTVAAAIARSVETHRARQQLSPWRTRYETLSRREIEVFELVATGKRNIEIARKLGISVRTAKAHRGRLMQKMGVASLAELVHIYNELKGQGKAVARM
jgi:FixJ family two-component response regulator